MLAWQRLVHEWEIVKHMETYQWWMWQQQRTIPDSEGHYYVTDELQSDPISQSERPVLIIRRMTIPKD
jgi:hypothetical protein